MHSHSPFQPLQNLFARVVLMFADVYFKYTPLKTGKGRICGYIALLLRRLGRLDAQLMPMNFEHHRVNLWIPPCSGVGVFVRLIGAYEFPEIARCVRSLSKRTRPVFLDVGANCGIYTTVVAVTCPNARVIAVEAAPDVAALLRNTISENRAFISPNDATVEIIESALSDQDGKTVFNRSWDNGLGSVHGVEASPRDSITVPTKPGDHLLVELGVDSVDFLKIDVEGGEMLVLQGFTESLQRGKIRQLQIELNKKLDQHKSHNNQDVLNFLRTHGYGLCSESKNKFEANHWLCENFVFEPLAGSSQDRLPSAPSTLD